VICRQKDLLLRSDHRLGATFREDTAAALFIQNARVGFSSLEVGLITGDNGTKLPRLRELAAILHARVALLDTVFEGEFEIADLAVFPDEEGIVFERLVRGGPAGDGAVLDRPKIGVAVPAGEIFAVEKLLLLARCETGEGKREREK
jgi:hypothetical protein